MTELGSKLSNWIWINTPDAAIRSPNLCRPNLPIGERLFYPTLDYIEKFMGTKDILFQIRDHLFKKANNLILNTRSIRNYNLRANILMSRSYVHNNIWRLPNTKKNKTSNSKPATIIDDREKYVLDEALVGGWLRQQFASWALAYHREISPLINISIEVVDSIRESNVDDSDGSKVFRIDGPHYENFEPSAKFQCIVPAINSDINLKNSDFEKSYCEFGCKMLYDKFEIDYSSILPLVSANHIRIFWQVQPWLMHTGEHETWILAGGDEKDEVTGKYGGWKMLPDNVFVPLSIKNIVLMGRMTKHNDGIQPVRGSLIIRYLGVA